MPQAKDVSKEVRDKMAKKGDALPDGSFPIANETDLKNAISSYGRAKNKAAAKRHIIKRAKALGKTDLLPADWEGSTKQADEPGTSDVHVPGLLKISKRNAYGRKLMEMIKKSGRFTDDEWAKMMKQARAHAGGKGRALKADESESPAEAELELELEDEAPTGLMIALYPSADVAAQLAIAGGEPVEDLHLTLCFLGDASIYPTMTLARLMTAVEDTVRWCTPLVGEISGTGRFTAEDEMDVFYASVDVPELVDLRERIENRLINIGMPPEDDHGFDPHITLAYLDKGAASPVVDVGGIPLRFDSVFICIGDEHIAVPMQGVGLAYSDVLDLCADGHGWRLFNELQRFAEPPEWIPYLPKPGTYTSPRYGEIKITTDRVENFIKNFEDHVYQEKLPIDAEHETKLSGALGWITKLRVNDDGSVDARAEWTDRGTQLIEADRFKYFSPEWFEEWTDPATEEKFKDVAVGGALTTRPFFKEKSLRPLIASERGLEETSVEPSKLSETTTIIFTALAPVKEREAKAMAEKTATAATGADDKVDEPNEPQNFAELKAEIERERTARQAAEAETQKQQERIASLEREGRTRRFTTTVRDSEGDGSKRFIGDESKHVEFLEKLSEKFGETSDEVKHYITEQQSHAEQMRSSNLFKEVGRSGGGEKPSAFTEMDAKAKERQKEKKISYEQAFDEVMVEEPALYQRSLQEEVK